MTIMDYAMEKIETNFTIPEGYRREFRLSADGFEFVVIADFDGLFFGERGLGALNPKLRSLCLDWMKEAIEHIRKEVTAGEQ